MKFWDASAVIPLFLEEPETPRMLEIARLDGGMVAWWGTVVECRSAVARLRRETILTTSQEDQAIRLLAVPYRDFNSCQKLTGAEWFG